MAKKVKLKANIQGIDLWGRKNVIPMGEGVFAYRKRIYNIEDFSGQEYVNLESTEVEPIGRVQRNRNLQQEKRQLRRSKRPKKSYAAVMLSNLEECPDAKIT